MNKTLCKRVSRLESRVPPVGAEPTAEEIRFRQAFSALLQKMDPQYARYITVDMAERGGKSNLSFAAQVIALQHVRLELPLELPACAAEVYLVDPTATPHDPCGECGYLSPFTRGNRDPPQPAVSYLKVCPLCGGKIRGSYLFANNKEPARRTPSAECAPVPGNEGA